MGRSGKTAAKKRRLLEAVAKAADRPSTAKQDDGKVEGLYWIDKRGAEKEEGGACRGNAGIFEKRARSCATGGRARKKRRRAIVDSDVDVSDSAEEEDEEKEHARLIREDFAQNCSSTHGRR